jgi:hypothetical protein
MHEWLDLPTLLPTLPLSSGVISTSSNSARATTFGTSEIPPDNPLFLSLPLHVWEAHSFTRSDGSLWFPRSATHIKFMFKAPLPPYFDRVRKQLERDANDGKIAPPMNAVSLGVSDTIARTQFHITGQLSATQCVA